MNKRSGFTIVELLVVIVVIGVLAAITIVSYSGISQKATIASIQTDLSAASKQLKSFNAINGTYPTANNCTNPSATEICLKNSGTNSFSNYTGTSKYFFLISKNGSLCYEIDSNSAPKASPNCSFDYVVVGDQIWAKSNVNVGTRTNPFVCRTDFDGDSNPYSVWCMGNNYSTKECYSNLESNCTSDGGLYDYNVAMQGATADASQGVCASGSHIPTWGEWTTLVTYLGGTATAGTAMKQGGSSGLNLALAGYRRSDDGTLFGRGMLGYYLSSRYNAYVSTLTYITTGANVATNSNLNKEVSVSVRCIKD